MKMILKIIVSAVVIFIASLIPGGYSVDSFGTAIVAAIVIGILDWAIAKFSGIEASPFGRGTVGFLVCAIILFLTGKLVDGFNATIFQSLIGALILGIVDAIIPGGDVFKK